MEEYLNIISGYMNQYISRTWKIIAVLTLMAIMGGCIGKENVPAQNTSENLSFQKNVSNLNESKFNKIELKIVRLKNFNTTGILNLDLNIKNPRMNETALMIFKSDSGVEGRYRSNITNITNNTWTQEFSLKVPNTTRSLQMFVEIYDNNSVVKKTECEIQVLNLNKTKCNITFEAPVGRPN